MVRDAEALAAFERELCRRTPVDFEQNRRLFEAMWQQAVRLGVLPSDDPLEGIEVDVKLARALSVRPSA